MHEIRIAECSYCQISCYGRIFPARKRNYQVLFGIRLGGISDERSCFVSNLPQMRPVGRDELLNAVVEKSIVVLRGLGLEL